jgi:hypothetical protein
MRPRASALALLCVVALSVVPGVAGAQELPPVEPPPALTAAQTQALDREIDKLRNHSAEGRAKTEAVIIGMGRGAIPALVEQCHTVHAGQQAGLVNCLLGLTDMRDRDLVEQSLTAERVPLRRFAARKVGELKIPAQIDKLPALLADKDEAVRTEAAISLIENGREEGLPVATIALNGPQGARVKAALHGVAGKGDHAGVAAMLKIDPKREREEPEVAAKERIAAVAVLHAIGDKPAQVLLMQTLGDHHNIVQRDAINALRDLLEQQPPMQGSSIFQQIKEVERLKKLWKEREG